jgi:hypothetical protein
MAKEDEVNEKMAALEEALKNPDAKKDHIRDLLVGIHALDPDVLKGKKGFVKGRYEGILQRAVNNKANDQAVEAILENSEYFTPGQSTKVKDRVKVNVRQRKRANALGWNAAKRWVGAEVRGQDHHDKVGKALDNKAGAILADMLTKPKEYSNAKVNKFIKDNIRFEHIEANPKLLQMAAKVGRGVQNLTIIPGVSKLYTGQEISDALQASKSRREGASITERNKINSVEHLEKFKKQALKEKMAALEAALKLPDAKKADIEYKLADIHALEPEALKGKKGVVKGRYQGILQKAVNSKANQEAVSAILDNKDYFIPDQLKAAKKKVEGNKRDRAMANFFGTENRLRDNDHHDKVGDALAAQNVAVLKGMLNDPAKYSNAKVNKFIKDNIIPENLKDNPELLEMAVAANRGVKGLAAKIDKNFPHEHIIEALEKSKQKRDDLYKISGSRVPGTDAHREYVAARDARKNLKIMSKRVVKARIVDLKKDMKGSNLDADFDRVPMDQQLDAIIALDPDALQKQGALVNLKREGVLNAMIRARPKVHKEAISAILAHPEAFNLEQLKDAKYRAGRGAVAPKPRFRTDAQHQESLQYHSDMLEALNAPEVNVIVLDKMLEREDDKVKLNEFVKGLADGKLASKMPDGLLIRAMDQEVDIKVMLEKVNTNSFTIEQLAEAHAHAHARADVDGKAAIIELSLEKFDEVMSGKNPFRDEEVTQTFEKIAEMDPDELRDHLSKIDSNTLQASPILLDLALANTDIGIDVILGRADANTFTPERLENVHGKATTKGKKSIVDFSKKSFEKLLDKDPMSPEELEQFSKLASAMRRMDPDVYQECLKDITPEQVEANPKLLVIAAGNRDIGLDVILDKNPNLEADELLAAHGSADEKGQEVIEKFSLKTIDSLTNQNLKREYVSKMFEAVKKMNPKAMEAYVNEMNMSTLKAHIKGMKADREKDGVDPGEFEKALEAKRAKSESMRGRAGRLGNFMKNAITGTPPSNSPVKPNQAPRSFGR